MLYTLRVANAEGRGTPQMIEVRNAVDLTRAGTVERLDLNGDAHLDLRVLGGLASGEAWYKVWLYDLQRHELVWWRTTEVAPAAPAPPQSH